MCTTVIVGRLASATGRVIVGHNEDSSGRCVSQQVWVPGGSHPAGEMLEGEPGRARIPQAPRTLSTYWSNLLAPAPGSSFDQGLINEAGLVMCSNSGGSSYAGELSDEALALKEGGIGFLLRRAVMERAQSAHEAVRIAAELLNEYGYCSPARNYTFADAREAWVLCVTKGRQYAARRVPDDMVMLISNYLSIRTIDLADTENVIASPGLLDSLVAAGRHSGEGTVLDFSEAMQPDEVRLDSVKSIRMRTGWEAITGIRFPDPLHYPDLHHPAKPMTANDVKAVLRLTADETYIRRSCGMADAFHVSGEDISRINCRESWVAEPHSKPIGTLLWRCAACADANPYVPWFPLAGEVPEGYQRSDLKAARRNHFEMPAEMLCWSPEHSWFAYAELAETANFDPALLGRLRKVRDAAESRLGAFAEEGLELVALSEDMDEALRSQLAQLTRQACRQADEGCRRTLAALAASSLVVLESCVPEISVSDHEAEVAFTLRLNRAEAPGAAVPELSDVLWSLGFSGSKESALNPVSPERICQMPNGEFKLVFKAHGAARFAVPGTLMETYLRGSCGLRRFVLRANVRFSA